MTRCVAYIVFDRSHFCRWFLKDGMVTRTDVILWKKTDKLGEEMYFFKEHRPKTLCDPSIDCGHYNLEKVDVKRFLKENSIQKMNGIYEVPFNLRMKFSEKLRNK